MFNYMPELVELNLSNFDMSNVTDTASMLGSCNKLCTLRLDNCNNTTINKITTSYNFPTGKTPSGQNRLLYCKEENFIGIAYPGGWEPRFI